MMTLNFHHICRLCLEKEDCLLPLFEDECSLSSKINNLIPTLKEQCCSKLKKVHTGDGLPAQICTQCAQQINVLFTFKQRCESSNATLRQQINVKEHHITKEELNDGHESAGDEDSFSETERWLPDVKIEIKELKTEGNDDYPDSPSASEESQEEEISSPSSKKIMSVKDSSKCFSCNECGKKFVQRHNLARHARSHRKKAVYTCTQCGKGFQRRNTYYKHMQSHNSEPKKTYTCSECGKSFHHSHILKEHERVHTGERPYSCRLCGKSFGQGGNLTNHMRSHTGVRPFLCTVCGRRFGFNSTLSKHMMTHSGDRPYLCPVCGKSFSLTCTLKKHMLTHTDEKPFACQECGRRFNRKDHLKCHLRTHLPSSEAPPAENWMSSSVSEPAPALATSQASNVEENNVHSEVYSEHLRDAEAAPWMACDSRVNVDASRKPLLPASQFANSSNWLHHEQATQETSVSESNETHNGFCHCP